MAKTQDNALPQAPLPQGSLDLLVLQTLEGGKRHGYQIARHIQATSDDALRVEEGSLYPALHRMERRGWIAAEWGTSESNRRAKYYGLTPLGPLATEDRGRQLAGDGRGDRQSRRRGRGHATAHARSWGGLSMAFPALPYWFWPGDDRPTAEIDDEIAEETAAAPRFVGRRERTKRLNSRRR